MSAIRLARAATGREKLAEVRRRLPRPRRRPARRGRLRPGHARASPPRPGVPAAAAAAHDHRAVERPRGRPRRLRRARVRRDPRRAVPGQHGPRPARRRLPRAAARAGHRERRAARLRRGHHRLPRRRAAAPRSCTGVLPDLTVMGKVIGGGLPAAAYGGSRELMERIAPAGDVYQAGTLSGNPLAVAAGPRHARAARRGGLPARSPPRREALADGLREAAGRRARSRSRTTTGPADRVLLRASPCATTPAPRPATPSAYGAWCRALLARGVYPPPSQFEAWFPSLAHTPEHVDAHARGRGRRVRGDRDDATRARRARGRAAGRGRAARRRRRPTRRRAPPATAPADRGAGRRRTRCSSRRSARATCCTTARAASCAPTIPTSRCSPATASTRSGSARLAELGDLEAVGVLADVISLVRAGPRRGRPDARRRVGPGAAVGRGRARPAPRGATRAVSTPPHGRCAAPLRDDMLRRPSPIGTPRSCLTPRKTSQVQVHRRPRTSRAPSRARPSRAAAS